MKKPHLSSLFTLFFIINIHHNAAFGQCTGGTFGGTITPGAAWSSAGTNPANGGSYYTFAASAGSTYFFSFCGIDGGNSIYDTQITIRDNADVYAGGYNDDFCGLQSYVSWLAPATATYRVLVTRYNCLTQASLGLLVYRMNAPPVCPAGLGLGVTNVASLPYASGAGTTCGMGDELNAGNTTACGSTLYLGGEDRVWIFTPASSGQITISLTSTGSYTGLMLYNGCPFNGQGGACVASNNSATGNKSICVNVTAGVTYYLVLDSWPAPACNPYSNLTISAPAGAAGGATCATAINIPSLPFSLANENTACMGNDYSNASIGSCGTLYESGEDKVYRYVATAAECIGISISGASTDYCGFQVYNGCPGTAGTTCVGSAGGATGGNLSGSVTLPGAGTYYIIVDTWSPPLNFVYNISITSFGSGPVNDRPCNAYFLPLGIYLSGNNMCSGNADEPAMPGACSGWGAINTVWYRFIAPLSGCVKIRTILGSLANTIIAVYGSGASPVACGSGNTITYVSCNDNAPACGANTYNNSELILSGLAGGNNYYVVVDGVNNQTGSFTILAIDGGAGCSSPFPPVPGQDCALPFPICQQISNVPDPGYQAYGNLCDFGSPTPCTGGVGGCGPCATSCLCTGERGSVFYQILINGAGFLEFDIIPNDWPGAPSTAGTDYDFALYQTATAGSPGPSSCSNLVSPIRCHYSPLGVTGLYSAADGNSPPAYPGFGSAYRRGVNVVPGDAFLLNISNWTNSTSGFTLRFSAASPSFINFSPPPGGTVIWTGNTDTDWFKVSNWGGCAIPTCDLNANIPGFPVNQPVINAPGAICQSLDIGLGAMLTINPAFQIQICRDFLNNGSFTAANNSTVLFNNSTNNSINQYINGNVVAPNDFWHVVVQKPAGYFVKTNQNIDMTGNFTVTGATYGGNFDASGVYHKLSGNMLIDVSAPNVATYTAATTLEFNGITQTYLNRGGLNNVLMNQTGAGTLTLLDNLNGLNAWMVILGNLNLTYGKIITGANRVEVQNRAINAVSPGNANSYIENNSGVLNSGLRKYLNTSGGTGTYEFPVGTAAKGYQRMSWNLSLPFPTNVNYVNVGFNNTAPATNAALGAECTYTYHNGVNSLDNGFWQIQPSPSGNFLTGTFTPTLYNLNYTNAGPAVWWTVMYNKTGSNVAANWLLNPVAGAAGCGASPVTAVQRNGVSAAAVLLSAPLVYLGSAQAPTPPLPVLLLSFEASPMEKSIRLMWTTASESGNMGFEIQRSTDGKQFAKIGFTEGNGSSTVSVSYSFEDSGVKKGIRYYYRLKQLDFNGDFEYSKVVSASLIASADQPFSVYPNPYTSEAGINVFLKEDSRLHIEIFDAAGRFIASVADDFYSAGMYQFKFNAAEFGHGSGIYTLKIRINDTLYVSRLAEIK